MTRELISPELSQKIAHHVAIQNDYAHYFKWANTGALFRCIDKRYDELSLPCDWERRSNDIYAAAYMHAIAFDHGNGDDCLDEYGNKYEVKLTQIKSRDLFLGDLGAINHKVKEDAKKGTGLAQACNAKFAVHSKTSDDHHNQTTAYVLMSWDHSTIITGYIMSGDKVKKLLGGSARTSVNRAISLSQFQTYGHEFNSCVPHIGWNRYETALRGWLMAREGRLPPDEAEKAIEEWIDLANPSKLISL